VPAPAKSFRRDLRWQNFIKHFKRCEIAHKMVQRDALLSDTPSDLANKAVYAALKRRRANLISTLEVLISVFILRPVVSSLERTEMYISTQFRYLSNF
jgi:hypothetical protein